MWQARRIVHKDFQCSPWNTRRSNINHYSSPKKNQLGPLFRWRCRKRPPENQTDADLFLIPQPAYLLLTACFAPEDLIPWHRWVHVDSVLSRERDRQTKKHTHASTDTPVCWPKKGIDIKKWENPAGVISCQTIYQPWPKWSGLGRSVEVGRQLEVYSTWNRAQMRELWGWDPWEQIFSFYWCKSSASVAWQHTTKWWVSGTIIATLLVQMIEWVVCWWDGWGRPSRRQWLSQFLSVIKDKYNCTNLHHS